MRMMSLPPFLQLQNERQILIILIYQDKTDMAALFRAITIILNYFAHFKIKN